MKNHLLLTVIVIGSVLIAGCRTSEFGKVKTKGLFANLEFDTAEGYLYEIDPSGKTNKIEHWRITGLKSDTQKSLETINKALEKIPQKP